LKRAVKADIWIPFANPARKLPADGAGPDAQLCLLRVLRQPRQPGGLRSLMIPAAGPVHNALLNHLGAQVTEDIARTVAHDFSPVSPVGPHQRPAGG